MSINGSILPNWNSISCFAFKIRKNWLWMNLRTTKSKFHFMLCNSRKESKTGNETNNWIVWLWKALKKCRSIWPLHWRIGWVEKDRTNVQCAKPSLELVGHFETASTEVQLVLTTVSSGGKLKTDSFVWVLMRVYYQIEIPYPVSHLKSGKNWFEWIWNSISCCAYQHRKTKEEMELMTFGLSPGHLYGLYQFSCGTGNGISIW